MIIYQSGMVVQLVVCWTCDEEIKGSTPGCALLCCKVVIHT